MAKIVHGDVSLALGVGTTEGSAHAVDVAVAGGGAQSEDGLLALVAAHQGQGLKIYYIKGD